MVFQRVPEDLQHVALGAFDAAVDLGALEALGARDDAADAVLDGGRRRADDDRPALEAATKSDKPAIVNIMISARAQRKPQQFAWLTR